jgi:Flagellar biosynthesis protein, FliO
MTSSSIEGGVEVNQVGLQRFPRIPTLVAAVRRMFLGRVGARRMELVEALPLGGRRQLMLVVCDGQSFLIGAGSDGVHSIVGIQQHASTAGGRSSMPGEVGFQLAPNSSGQNAELRP